MTRWLQFLVGARYDSFDLSALDQNTNIQRNRVDDKVSPRAAVIVKPIDTVSLYTAWSISYLPASGDQFSALSPGTLILQPQKFENTEIGAKWNINPKLLFTAAAYELIRTNVPIADPSGNGLFFPSGAHKIRGFETALTGYVTPDWQSPFGYAYTDARITSATSPTIVPGNRVQLVPYNQFSLWNKYQIDPIWSAALGVIYFSDSFASSDDTVRLPGFVRVDAAVYAKLSETLEDAAQRREHLQQGLLGDRRRQQQHLAGPAAYVPPDRDREILARSGEVLRVLERTNGQAVQLGVSCPT